MISGLNFHIYAKSLKKWQEPATPGISFVHVGCSFYELGFQMNPKTRITRDAVWTFRILWLALVINFKWGELK
jgi:hypothetical protein